MDSDKNNKKMVPATKPINLIWLISLGVGSFMVALVVFYSLFSMLRQQNTNEIAVVEAGQYTGTVYDPPVQLTDFTSPVPRRQKAPQTSEQGNLNCYQAF